jgi:hypothetical protein
VISHLTVFLTTIPSIFGGVYQQSVGIAGLHYIALGVGVTGASQLNAKTMDKVYVYFKSKNGGVAKPEFRLRSSCCSSASFLECSFGVLTAAMVPGSVLLPIGCLIVGWTSEAHTHWIAPDIVGLIFLVLFSSNNFQQGITLVGAGIILNFQCIQAYIIDCFTLHAASGTHNFRLHF